MGTLVVNECFTCGANNGIKLIVLEADVDDSGRTLPELAVYECANCGTIEEEKVT